MTEFQAERILAEVQGAERIEFLWHPSINGVFKPEAVTIPCESEKEADAYMDRYGIKYRTVSRQLGEAEVNRVYYESNCKNKAAHYCSREHKLYIYLNTRDKTMHKIYIPSPADDYNAHKIFEDKGIWFEHDQWGKILVRDEGIKILEQAGYDYKELE